MKDAPAIRIVPQDANSFRVEVAGETPSAHIVTISDAAHAKLTAGRMSKPELLAASFRFLLQREPNTAILPRFEIEVIARYFPDYPNAMRAEASKKP